MPHRPGFRWALIRLARVAAPVVVLATTTSVQAQLMRITANEGATKHATPTSFAAVADSVDTLVQVWKNDAVLQTDQTALQPLTAAYSTTLRTTTPNLFQRLQLADWMAGVEKALKTHSDATAAARKRVLALTDFITLVAKGPIRRFVFPVPLLSSQAAQCYWQNDSSSSSSIQAVPGFDLSGENKGAAINAEAVADYVGGVRTSLSTAISTTGASSADSIKSNAQRFLTGGGNATINLQYPLFQFATGAPACTASGTATGAVTDSGTSAFSFQMVFWPRVGLDLPAIGTPTTSTNYMMDVGVNSRMVLRGASKQLGFFLGARTGWVPFGSTGFYTSIGRTGGLRSFGYVQFDGGFVVTSKVLFSFSTPLAAPADVRANFRGIFGVSLTR